jgi:hypothetical protein
VRANIRTQILHNLIKTGGVYREKLFGPFAKCCGQDEEGSDLVDGSCSAGDQPRANPMAGLQIELILALLPDGTQVGP